MRLITVQFAVPEDDPAVDSAFLVDRIQELLYDEDGMDGWFRIVGNIECVGEPRRFAALTDPK